MNNYNKNLKEFAQDGGVDLKKVTSYQTSYYKSEQEKDLGTI